MTANHCTTTPIRIHRLLKGHIRRTIARHHRPQMLNRHTGHQPYRRILPPAIITSLSLRIQKATAPIGGHPSPCALKIPSQQAPPAVVAPGHQHADPLNCYASDPGMNSGTMHYPPPIQNSVQLNRGQYNHNSSTRHCSTRTPACRPPELLRTKFPELLCIKPRHNALSITNPEQCPIKSGAVDSSQSLHPFKS